MSDVITIHEAAPAAWSAWDALLDRVPGTSPLAQSGWLVALARAYRVPSVVMLAHAQGAVIGGCAGYIVRDAAGARMFFSLHHGFVVADAAAAAPLAKALTMYARERGIVRLTLGSGTRAYAIDEVPITRTTITIPVASSPDAQWCALRNKTRNMVRKAERAGCIVRGSSGARDLAAFHRIYARRMLAKGVPIHPRRFFAAVLAAVPDAELLVAERAGRVIGGLLLCTGKHVAAYPYQAAAFDADQFAPTSLLVWEALRRCAARGVSLLDMGESAPGSSVYAAKLHMGGIPSSVYVYQPLNDGPVCGSRAAVLCRAATAGMRYAPMPIRAYCGVWLKQRGRIV